MKLLSWNVNGIRSVMKKGFMDFLSQQDPDVLCLQETKTGRNHENLLLPGYVQYWNSAERPGYSGTAVFSKKKPLSVDFGIGHEEHETEGRVITAEFPDYYLVTVYTPNSGRGLARLEYRQGWDELFLDFLKNLEKKKPVVVCGDLNVAHKEIDLARPKQNVKNAGFTPEEREGFERYIEAGFIDTFREFCTDGDQYSWWTYMHNAREKNIGWRIDYFLVSASLKSKVSDAFILQEVFGSDHCPVGIVIKK